MLLLTAGVGLWSLAHWVKRLAPALREKLGNGGKGLIAVAILASVAMMVVGYGRAEGSFYWGRSPAMVGVNNLLMLLALYLMVAATTRAWVTGVIRHPQLTAMKSWAVAHLLVNGDTVLGSVRRLAGLGGGERHPDQQKRTQPAGGNHQRRTRSQHGPCDHHCLRCCFLPAHFPGLSLLVGKGSLASDV